MLASSCISYMRRKYYFFVDSTMRFKKSRWMFTLALVIQYFYRTIGLSYDIITYLIGFYLLQMMVSYFTPKGLEEEQLQYIQFMGEQGQLAEDINLPNDGQQMYEMDRDGQKPLISSINELQIWERVTFAFTMGIVCTFFKSIEIDVFWPLLMIYFIVLVCYTIQKIIRKMEKYRYSIADFGKKPIPFEIQTNF